MKRGEGSFAELLAPCVIEKEGVEEERVKNNLVV